MKFAPLYRRAFEKLFFGNGRIEWRITDPESEELHAGMARLRHGSAEKIDVGRVLEAAESYIHLTTYELGQEHCVAKLRHIWRTLRAERSVNVDEDDELQRWRLAVTIAQRAEELRRQLAEAEAQMEREGETPGRVAYGRYYSHYANVESGWQGASPELRNSFESAAQAVLDRFGQQAEVERLQARVAELETERERNPPRRSLLDAAEGQLADRDKRIAELEAEVGWLTAKVTEWEARWSGPDEAVISRDKRIAELKSETQRQLDYIAAKNTECDEKQEAIEILGRAIGEVIPDARSSGGVVDHARGIAEQLTYACRKKDARIEELKGLVALMRTNLETPRQKDAERIAELEDALRVAEHDEDRECASLYAEMAKVVERDRQLAEKDKRIEELEESLGSTQLSLYNAKQEIEELEQVDSCDCHDAARPVRVGDRGLDPQHGSYVVTRQNKHGAWEIVFADGEYGCTPDEATIKRERVTR